MVQKRIVWLAVFTIVLAALFPRHSLAQMQDRFLPLTDKWPTPTRMRPATGAPAAAYWQQKVNYKIRAVLDMKQRTLLAEEAMDYRNNSPDTLPFLWLEVSQDQFRANSTARLSHTATPGPLRPDQAHQLAAPNTWGGGAHIEAITDGAGRPLSYSRQDTYLRIDLPKPLAPKSRQIIHIKWRYRINRYSDTGNGRDGYECFSQPKTDCIFEMSQWFPRAIAYSDFKGWHLDPFLGFGSFALEFGDYDVALTVPANAVVSATGALQNPVEVLSKTERDRLAAAHASNIPIYVVTPEEAILRRKADSAGTRTWHFMARNVRDFTWAASQSFIWDAMGVSQNAGPKIMAMSFYPQEAAQVWSVVATRAIAHTIETDSARLFPDPYPVIQAVNGPVEGFEYPMIVFVGGGRPDAQGQYNADTIDSLTETMIHEVGHQWFPILVNSDEREFPWLDEGLNAFLQYETGKSWRADFPDRRGDPAEAYKSMTNRNQLPIMSRGDSLTDRHWQGYGKPATALVVLREVVLGAKRFDEAFRAYAQEWKFKRPTMFDFFRTMEQVSGTDLDWFWRGWFYSTDFVDLSLASIHPVSVMEAPASPPAGGSVQINDTGETYVGRDPVLQRLYRGAGKQSASLSANASAVTAKIYRFNFRNGGGLVSPIPLEISYADGSTSFLTIPAEVWRRSLGDVLWDFASDKVIIGATIDPHHLTGDVDATNNSAKVTPATINETH